MKFLNTKIIIAFMLFAMCFCISCGGLQPSRDTRKDEIEKMIKTINPNSMTDIFWMQGFDGVKPILSDRVENVINKITKNDLAHVYDMLKDNNYFWVAHIVLTLKAGIPYYQTTTEWNDLEIKDITVNGPIIDMMQKPKLLEKWSYLSSNNPKKSPKYSLRNGILADSIPDAAVFRAV